MNLTTIRRCMEAVFVATMLTLETDGTPQTALSASESPSSPGTGGAVISPSKGNLAAFDPNNNVRVTFPNPMVGLDEVKRGGRPSPIQFEPVVEVRWIWVSPTEGRLTFPDEFVRDNISELTLPRAPIRNILHRAKLRPGLKDLAGKPVDPGNWGIEFADDEFALRGLEFLNVFGDAKAEEEAKKEGEKQEGAPEQTAAGKQEEKSTQSGETDGIMSRLPNAPLPARPRVRLEFSRDVAPQDVVKAVYFQDSSTHERFPIEADIEERQSLNPQGWVLVEPLNSLPAGHSYVLVIEPLKEAKVQEALPHMRVVVAGTAFPLQVLRIAGLNQPQKGAFIRITANQKIDPDLANLKLVSIHPAVADLHVVADGKRIELQGNFNTAEQYQVTLNAGLKSEIGFSLEKDSLWKARFHPKRPAIILPDKYIFQRASSPDVRLSFTQVNTDKLEWKIAQISPDKIPEVFKRLREFETVRQDENKDPLHNAETGEYLYESTALLIPTLELPLLASGSVDGARDDKEILREVRWSPGSTDPGLYLLEVSGKDLQGRQVGSRSIISRSDWVISRIERSGTNSVCINSMNDGKPVSGVPVEVLNGTERVAAHGVTDAGGEAFLGEDVGDEILAGAPGRQCVQLWDLPAFPSGGLASPRADQPSEMPCVIVSDRNVYRPGETVKFKGFVRNLKDGRVSIPANEPIQWSITDAPKPDAEPLYQAAATISATGSWEGAWQIPTTALGDYFISAADCRVKVTVAEFRPPPFSVVTETEDAVGDTVRAKVVSTHFYGAPNAGAKVRWKAEWMVDDWRRDEWFAAGVASGDEDAKRVALVLDDKHSPDSPARGFSDDLVRNLAKAGWETAREDREVSISATAQGETTLDGNGTAAIECKSPFPPDAIYGRAKVYWIVDVTSASAQTQRGGAVAKVQFVPQILGVSLEQNDRQSLYLQVASLDSKDRAAGGLAAKVELFRVDVKTVKERLGPSLNRYRNFPAFEKVWQGDVVTPARCIIKVATAGNYVVRATAPQQPRTPQVSDAATVEGNDKVEVRVDNESRLDCKSDRERYGVGETATISVQSPFTGVATVTVETDRVLYREVVELQGNLQQISVPVQPSFAPNAYVCVHLIKPAAGETLPAERFGFCAIKVDRTDQRLRVVASLKSDTVEPGTRAAGTVKVTAGGKPVAGADVMLFAVDEAVLALGRWRLPDFAETFFPRRSWELITHTALGKLWTPERPDSLSHSQKGFILGDGGPLVAGATFRKDFRPLAFWNGSLPTNANGEVPFEFTAPEGLTSYRVVAVAQNGAEQFGNAQAMLRLAKRLQVEPALPDFLRNGDEVVLSAIVRQDYADSDEIDVAVAPDAALKFSEPPGKRVTARRREPVLVGVRAQVAGDVTGARLRFAARSVSRPEIRDGEENSVSIHPAVLERRQTIFGPITPRRPINISALAPPQWLASKGYCDVLLSGSPFLPKLAGLPEMLDAQGSIEKISTRILAATLLAETLEYLPLGSGFEKQLRTKVQDGLRRFAGAILDDGGLPVWPSGKQLNDFATVEAAWAILNAEKHGFDVDQLLNRRAKSWLTRIVGRETGFEEVSPDIRCFALMVLGSTRTKEDNKEERFEAEAGDLFNNRQLLTDEGRAWLALATYYFDILPEAVKTLLGEVKHPAIAVAFDPATFSSKTRVEAICLLAQSEIESTNWSGAMREQARRSFDAVTQSSVDLSTQENLWLLLLFNSLTRGEIPSAMGERPFSPKPAVSKNRISVGWLNVPLSKLAETFLRPLQPGVGGTYLIRATYQAAETEVPQHDPSLSIERMERNLTDASRTGTEEAPFKLGDQVLVTYRLNADKPHSYVEVEDQLPACFETVNPKLPLIAQHFQLPIEAGVNTLPLSHVELRFARTLLYFDKTLPGRNVYSVLERVTTAGLFHWPGTQVRPLYDSRFLGVSDSMIVHAE